MDIKKPNIPAPEEVSNGIVRMNCGHDSNIERDLVIQTAKQYKHFFFNTSIPRFDFPGPVVFTANGKEEKEAIVKLAPNLMFVRLRVSPTNLGKIKRAIQDYVSNHVPIILTFMAYYEEKKVPHKQCYEYKTRHINSYWCPTKGFQKAVMCQFGGRLVTMCGTFDSNYCRDCRNCETYYWQTIKRLKESNGNAADK